MSNFYLSALLSLLVPAAAHAYLPPAFFIYGRITEQRSKIPAPTVQISVSRPLGSGTEEIIGSLTLNGWKKEAGGWPALSLLFAENPDDLIQAVSEFGIPVAREQDLTRAAREQISAMKDPPRPFYKSDKRMGLKRYRQTYAWVNREGARSIWVEKDTFLPLKIEGPCPGTISEISWAKAGDGVCELEFRNVYSLRRGSPQNSRITVWKDGDPVLFLSFDRVIPPKAGSAPGAGGESSLPAPMDSLVKLFLH